MRFFTLFLCVLLTNLAFAQVSNPGLESMGTAPSTVAITAHEAANNFDIDPFTYSGTGDLRNTTPSSGYAGASGLANVFLTSGGTRTFIIDGIQAGPSCDQLDMDFGIFKSTVAENGSSLLIDYSINGAAGTWISAGGITLPTGTGTATWSLATITGMPATTTSIRFTNSAAATLQFRIDDVKLTAIGPSCLSLPVELESFKASQSVKSVELNFVTASERNNDYFMIERSADGRIFEKIGEINGAGNSNERHYYSMTDREPLSGINIYRLALVDFDNKITYSNLVSVRFERTGEMVLTPSPASDRMQVNLESPSADEGGWQIFDSAGRLVMAGTWQSETISGTIGVAALNSGMYTFRLTTGSTVLVKQFRKI